jgi:hypothetical protein
LFVLLGVLLIPRAGFSADEALFTTLLYGPLSSDFELGVLRHKIPVMLIAYVGTFKTLLCWPILRLFASSTGPAQNGAPRELVPDLTCGARGALCAPGGPAQNGAPRERGPDSTRASFALRLPMVLVGAATILLFFVLADSLAGRAAALVAAVLLATDTTFLLTDTFDWGPVALEHLLLVSGCLAMASRRSILACFLFGLALWNKATFVWALSGLAAAALIAYWPECRRRLRDRRLLTCCGLAFLAGALPLLLFNLHRNGATLRSTSGFSTQDFGLKLHELRAAADGSGLFGFLTAEDSATPHPKSPAWRAGVHFGEFRSSLFPYAIVLAILATPLWWQSPGRRAGIFAIVFCAVAFTVMAITRGAGTGIHHTVLLWPMPQLLAGVAWSAVRPRWIVPVLTAILAASNLLVIGQYFVQLDQNGAGPAFTDALPVLSNALSQAPNQSVYVADWGIYEALLYLQQGRSALHYSPWLLVAENPNAGQFREIDAMIADPNGVFVTHVAAREVFPGIRVRLDRDAASTGYEKRLIRTIEDSNSRPVFELWRFYRADHFRPSK